MAHGSRRSVWSRVYAVSTRTLIVYFNKNRQVELKGFELLAPDCQLPQDRSIHHII